MSSPFVQSLASSNLARVSIPKLPHYAYNRPLQKYLQRLANTTSFDDTSKHDTTNLIPHFNAEDLKDGYNDTSHLDPIVEVCSFF